MGLKSIASVVAWAVFSVLGLLLLLMWILHVMYLLSVYGELKTEVVTEYERENQLQLPNVILCANEPFDTAAMRAYQALILLIANETALQKTHVQPLHGKALIVQASIHSGKRTVTHVSKNHFST